MRAARERVSDESRKHFSGGSNASLGDLSEGVGDGGNVDDDIGAFDLERETDGIAATGFADRGNVNGGGAVAADDVLAVLAIAFRAADAASIERDAPALRLLDDKEAKILRTGIHLKSVQVPVLDFSNRNADQIRCSRNGVRRRWSRACAGVNKVGGENENDGKAGYGSRDHPATLAAALGFKKALLGFVCCGIFGRGRSEPFAKDEKHGRAENKNEKEKFVANDGTDKGHFLFARRKPAGFAEFMQARDRELRGDEPENDGGHREKAVERNLDGPFEKEKPDGDGGGEAEDPADPGLQAGTGEFDSAEN